MSTNFDPIPMLTRQLGLPEKGVAATARLLADGATVPFISRYRKEATGGLDEVQVRAIEERRAYLLALEERRTAIINSVEQQGKMTDELLVQLCACDTKAALEDLYLPYKRKRRTRATVAREKGLEPLAQRILEQPPDGHPKAEAHEYVDIDKGIEDRDVALAGARDIVAEQIAERADVRAMVRRVFFEQGALVSERAKSKNKSPSKYEQYYDFSERVTKIPSHRYLAICRGENEGVLRASITVDADRLCVAIEDLMHIRRASGYADQLSRAVRDSYKRLIVPSVENDVRAELKERSDRAAIEVFAGNLRNLLLAPPLGGKRVIAIDPGLRTGCKCAALDETGKFLETITVHLTKGEAEEKKAREAFLALFRQHEPGAIGIGSGTGGRQADAWVRNLLAKEDLEKVVVVPVNESGASVYSASEVAREELPDLDVTIRGAVSIGRRLQDPLAELVKIEPKSIGVGQYQHDVDQTLLHRKLGDVVESCVNHVGVALNTASPSLLTYVAGIGPALARKIVAHREASGRFDTRAQLLEVSGLGTKAFEQAAGFLRIAGGSQPLDASAVHPERYELVETIAADLGSDVASVVGNTGLAGKIEVAKYVSDDVGEPTLRDIIAELKKPGRDPRKRFEPTKFRDDVRKVEDLVAGMKLEGVVTNVADFGAFVDIGVHQDGLVHISELADRFVKEASEVVKVGDKLQVRVVEVDFERKRISLSARSESAPRPARKPARKPAREGGEQRDARGRAGERPRRGGKENRRRKGGGREPREHKSKGFSNNPFAVLANLKKDQ